MNFPRLCSFLFLSVLATVSPLSAAQAESISDASGGDWNVTDHVPLEKVIVQGHRGVGNLAEENTVEAFELAWRMGLYPESDLRMTRDGVIVPFHDNDFSRVVKNASP